jgi:uncharacterized membrane protein
MVVKRAWIDSVAFVGWNRQRMLLVALPGVVAFVFLLVIPGADGFVEYLRSGFFAVIVSLSVFALIFAIKLLLTPSRIDYELREELSRHMQRLEQRADKDEIAQVLQERYDLGAAILGGRATLDYREALDAYRWHADNLRIFKDLIPRNEYFMYKTIAPDPEPSGGARKLPFIARISYRSFHEQRLGKLRLILGRMLDE